jgi:two-component sensor histidine kinase
MEPRKSVPNTRQQAALARSALDALVLSIAVLDEEGTIVVVNDAWRTAARSFGAPEAGPMIGVNYLRVCEGATGADAAVAASAAAGIRAVLAGESPEFTLEYPCHDPGHRRWYLMRVTRFEQNGRTFAVVAHESITERKHAEEQVRFLMSEINHRAKNLLAIVQSIARQTAHDETSRDFARRLGERLQSLASSQDVITRGHWRSAAVADLVHSQLDHLGETGRARVHATGEDVLLRPAAAQVLGMAIHELATNSMKYGALSGEMGEVAVSWSLEPGDGGRRFRMSWGERGGPPVEEPTQRGFGRTLIEVLVPEAVGGRAEVRYERSGLCWILEAPEDQIVCAEAASFAPVPA